VAASRRWFRRPLFHLLLWIYPRRFRAMFARDLAGLLDDLGGTPSFGVVWDLVTSGLGARWDDARLATAARKRSARATLHHRYTVPGRSGLSMESITSDIRTAVRGLRQRPGFAAAIILTLGIGIGATTTIFSLVDGVVLRPLPYPDHQRLVALGTTFRGRDQLAGVSLPNYIDWRDQSRSFESMGAARRSPIVLVGDGDPEEVRSAMVTPQILELLGAQPIAGRRFASVEYAGSDAVILAHGLWQRRFGGDPEIVGQVIDTRDATYRVVGVLPSSFEPPVALGLGSTELWLPLDQQSPGWSGRGHRGFSILGKLAPGVTLAVAQEEMAVMAQQLADAYPEDNVGSDGSIFGIAVHALQDETVGEVSGTLWLLLGAVGFLLLIGCANVANLLMARATEREREMALRATLGAGRGRLVHQLLTESVVLALAGGVLGVWLAYAGVAAFQRLTPGNMPRLAQVNVDWRILVFAAVLSVGTGILFGLVPALQLSRLDLNDTLKEGATKSSGGRRHRRLRSALVVSEVTLALMLLTGAGLLINSLARLNRVELGFDPINAASMMVRLSPGYADDEAKVALFERVIDRVAQLPGVSRSAGIVNLPIGDVYWRPRITLEQTAGADDRPGVNTHIATPGVFEALGIGLRQGRGFSATDRTGQPLVAVVNEAFVAQFFGATSALGQRIQVGSDEPWRTIVGVVGNAKQRQVRADHEPLVYVPLYQVAEPFPLITVVARTDVEPTGLLRPMRQAVWAEDPQLVIRHLEPLETRVADSLAQDRFYTVLLGGFAVVAVLLSAIGIYGTMSYSVGQRVKELGIRMALGAQARDVMGIVLRQGLVLTLTGLALGLAGSVAASRVLSQVVFGITPTDMPTFGVVAAVMLIVGLGAVSIPAWRATRVVPLATLKAE
jgi:putative ABC transport system permease protein